MMYVKTKILPSAIHGMGVFADQFIPQGTLIWKFTPGFDRKFSQNEVEKLPQNAKQFLKTYAYLSKKSDKYVLPVDNGKFFNHSNNPNSLSNYKTDEEEVLTVAIKDIHVGEEITDDYNTFEKNAITIFNNEENN